MKVLSLFDGISCARVALERAGFKIEKYYASETDKYAIQIAQKNYQDTIRVGDITKLKGSDFKDIDLIIGGSPCQDLSISKKDRKGLHGKRSVLFWDFLRLIKEVHPKWWILENVASMSEASRNAITKALGENCNMSIYWQPKMIDAALVSAQSRKRLFWTNISGVTQPDDKGILLKDILEKEVDKKYFIKTDWYEKKGLDYKFHSPPYEGKATALRAVDYKGTHNIVRVGKIGKGGQGERIYSTQGKSTTLSAHGGGRGAKTGLYRVENGIRRLTPLEGERLQCLPDNYTEGISNTQRYKCVGNAFNVDVVAHILSFIKPNTPTPQ